jgi:outer membrane protein assembly factor BamA
MQRIIMLVLFVFVLSNLSAQLNETTINSNVAVPPSSKSGFAWGGTPVLAFDPDLGLKYGALINLFDYGDGTVFPNYNQYAFIRLFHSTGGTSNLSLLFESETLIPNSRITFESSYIKDITLDFFGFNGRNAIFNSAFIDAGSPDFVNRHFYTHHRELIRLKLDWQRNISDTNWKIFSGVNWNRFLVSDVDIDNLSNSEQGNGAFVENTTLYQLYANWGIIDEKEKNGGHISTLSLGFTYDSRNNKMNCSDGTWFESYLIASPPAISSSFYLKHIATFRHYVRWNTIDAVLAYRLSSQQLLAGKIPFYALPQYHDTRQDQDGVGGAFNLRGINRNRIAANGFLLGNIEMRKNVFSFNFFRLNWDIDVSLFTDAAYITREYKPDLSKVPPSFKRALFNNNPQNLNLSYGGGIYIIYNANNIISINYGISPDKQLGTSGVYIGSAFLF